MKERMTAEQRREQLLKVMQGLHHQAENQAEFTAEKVADTAGISTVLLYRYVGAEFKALRNQLPGSHRSADETLRELRRENDDLRLQLRDAQEKLRTTAVEELDEAVLLIERLEEENLQLRGENRLLRKRLEEGGRVIVPISPPNASSRGLALVNSANYSGSQGEEATESK
jgi:FtsZ-binding cell division protein ZapB